MSTPETVPFEKRSLEEWQVTIDVNLTGVFLCSKHVGDLRYSNGRDNTR